MAVDPVAVFRALGHRARLQIAEELGRGERCVADLVGLVGLSWPSVSRHLSVLRAAGVVADERRGNQIVYSLALPCVGTFARCLAAAARGQRVELRTCCR
ncbi:MAG: winged helix-turn-helix transcriptional regulator [Planctomycetes bacterium]|nr:winged helix-turn-helix transcriptional regulator [Planctomycetota bacterium]